MATLIPFDALTRPDIPPADVLVGTAIRSFSPDDVSAWYCRGISARPTYLLLSPELGVVLLDVVEWSPGDLAQLGYDGVTLTNGTTDDPMVRLGGALEHMRIELADWGGSIELTPVFALPAFDAAAYDSLGLGSYFSGVCTVPLCGREPESLAGALACVSSPVDPEVITAIRQRLFPDTSFVLPRRVRDDGRGEREALRIMLDARQESVARSIGSGITLLTGVAGSGKSLVLAARARLLADEHPDWRIQLLCYNRSLRGYLQRLVGRGHENIHVDHVTKWLWDQGISGESAIQKASRKGIPKQRNDAVLIDEVQDFKSVWLRCARRTLCGKRGGMLIAGDSAQAIYESDGLEAAFDGEEIAAVDLPVNYRNTEQIGRFAQGSVFSLTTDWNHSTIGTDLRGAPDDRLSGVLVQLVYAANQKEQARAVMSEVCRLHDERQFGWGDMAILYASKFLGGSLSRHLDEADMPYYWVTATRESRDQLRIDEDSIKLITIHSSKGLEFPCVFLVGVESLKVPESPSTSELEDISRLNVAYVGMTRARDVLYVTYSKPNPVISRALDLKEWCETKSYPEDFE